MKNIAMSVGPIHGRLDSVKIITNKFKGGLAVKTAKELALQRPQDNITIVKCPQTQVYDKKEGQLPNVTVVDVDDFYDYEKFMVNSSFDAYILAAAVANLIPKTPYDGKFPSHNFKEGEEINIPFIIAPRIINQIKRKNPRSTLIGYKLFDGSPEELVHAGWETLVDSKANAIFCNHPEYAKYQKICLLPDGSRIPMSFDEHVAFISRILDLQWYSTKIRKSETPDFDSDSLITLLDRTKELYPPYAFGCVAMRFEGGFMTTLRGKTGDSREFAYISDIDHEDHTVTADRKASLNAPLLDLIFKRTDSEVILHSHRKIITPRAPYVFSGTTEEDGLESLVDELHSAGMNSFEVEHHGYYAWFKNIEEALEFKEKSRRKIAIDWDKYSEIYPERYLKESEFDRRVINEILSINGNLNRKIHVLEIGSNNQTRYSDPKSIQTYHTYDKNVQSSLTLSQLSEYDYDLIILRNSINYLNKSELSLLNELMIQNNATVLFNTFTRPTQIQRFYKSKQGPGVEITTYDEKEKVITHTLYPLDKEIAIQHTFFFYSAADYEKIFPSVDRTSEIIGNTAIFCINPQNSEG